MRLARRMLAASSKRALSSTTTATCLPLRAAADQVLDDAALARGAVERHLDGAHLGVLGRLREEALDRGGEGLVGVLQQDRAGVADDVEDVALGLQQRVVDRVVRRVVELRARQRGDLDAGRAAPTSRRPRRRPAPRPGRARRPACRGAAGSMPGLTSRRTIGANWRSRSSDSISASRSSASSSFRSVLALRVTRNSSQRTISMPGKSRSRLWQITSSRGTKRSRAPTRRKRRHAGADRHLDARQRELGVPRVAQRHQQVERQVRDERERVRRVDRLRRDQREDRARRTRRGPRLLLLRELVVVRQFDLLGPQQLHEAHGQLLHAHAQAADDLVAVVDLARRACGRRR